MSNDKSLEAFDAWWKKNNESASNYESAFLAGWQASHKALAVEPIVYQRRMRPTWMDEGTGWTPWENCQKESFLWSHKNPKIHDWEYEARALCLHPAQQVAVPETPEQHDYRLACEAVCEDDHAPPRQTPPQQVAVPTGYALVLMEDLIDIKNRVNTLATLSLKSERYSVGRAIKQDIADIIVKGDERK